MYILKDLGYFSIKKKCLSSFPYFYDTRDSLSGEITRRRRNWPIRLRPSASDGGGRNEKMGSKKNRKTRVSDGHNVTGSTACSIAADSLIPRRRTPTVKPPPSPPVHLASRRRPYVCRARVRGIR